MSNTLGGRRLCDDCGRILETWTHSLCGPCLTAVPATDRDLRQPSPLRVVSDVTTGDSAPVVPDRVAEEEAEQEYYQRKVDQMGDAIRETERSALIQEARDLSTELTAILFAAYVVLSTGELNLYARSARCINSLVAALEAGT